MKIKEGYLLREVAGTSVVVPVGNLDFDGMITLNETGALLWNALEKGTTRDALVELLLSEYEIERDVAERDVDAFLKKLLEANVIHE